jgi:hypothetical protein
MPYKNTEHRNEYHRKYYRENKIRVLGQIRKWEKNNPDMIREYKRRSTIRRRGRLLCIISGGNNPICIRCGCDDPRFLEINHKNGGGSKETRGTSKRQKFETAILSGARPIDDLEILCRACNAIHFLELKFGTIPMQVIWNKQP